MRTDTDESSPAVGGGDAPTLRPYQAQAVTFLHEKGNAALLLDMGLG